MPKRDMAFCPSINLDSIDAKVLESQNHVAERQQNMLISIIGITLLVLAIIARVGFWIANSILRPLLLMRANLDDIAAGEGDHTQRLAVTSQEELGELAGSFNRFVDKIHGLVRQIAEMTGQLTRLVGEVADQAQRGRILTYSLLWSTKTNRIAYRGGGFYNFLST